MSEEDRSYFRRRAEQERRAAKHASGPAADAHMALAARYAQLAGEGEGAEMRPQAATATPH